MNHLRPLLQQDTISEAEIDSALTAAQATVYTRAKTQTASGKMVQKVFSGGSIFSYLVPTLTRLRGQRGDIERIGLAAERVVKLDGVPVPTRERGVPYHDELPARPLLGVRGPTMLAVLLLGLVWRVSIWALRVDHLDPRTYAGGWLRRDYVGDGAVGDVSAGLLAVWSVPVAGPDLAAWVQLRYFISCLVVPIVLWTVEGYRAGNKLSLVRW